MNKWSGRFWVDLAERVGTTFVTGLITLLTMSAQLDLSWETLWPVVVLPTVLSLLKGLLANMAAPSSGASAVPHPPGPDV